MKVFMKPRLHKVFLDGRLNTLHTVRHNLSQGVAVVALKIVQTVRELHRQQVVQHVREDVLAQMILRFSRWLRRRARSILNVDGMAVMTFVTVIRHVGRPRAYYEGVAQVLLSHGHYSHEEILASIKPLLENILVR